MRLALDTSTTWTSIALVANSSVVVGREVAGVNPGEVVVTTIDELLRESGESRGAITGIDVGVGPGPYTSTRVGVAIARTLGFALEVEVVGVCSHDAIGAQVASVGAAAADEFVVATDARRSEVYWARYRGDGTRVAGPAVGKPADVAHANSVSVWFGNGLARHVEVAEQQAITVCEPTHPGAQWVAAVSAKARQAGGVVPVGQPALADHTSVTAIPIDLEQMLFAPYPLYLRRPDAVPSAAVVKQ